MLLDQDLIAFSADERATADSYVTMRGWRDNPGRPDLVDCVADEFERRTPARAPIEWTANYS
jgi:hypothetical protein